MEIIDNPNSDKEYTEPTNRQNTDITNDVSHQENTYSELNKPSKMNRAIIIFLIINTCITLAAIGGVVYLLINKLDNETKLNDLESEVKQLKNGVKLLTFYILVIIGYFKFLPINYQWEIRHVFDLHLSYFGTPGSRRKSK